MKRKKLLLLLFALAFSGFAFGQLSEGFETWPPTDWTIDQGACSPTNDITQSSTYAHSGTYSARFSSFSSCGSGYDEYLITPQLVTTSGDQTITFWYRRYSSGSEVFKVGWSSTGTDVSTDFTWSSEISDASTTWQQYSKTDLPVGTKYVAIHYYSNYQYYLYVDDVSGPALYVPSCPAPSAQTETNITTNSANLGWTENGTATTWNIEWGPTGFTQGSGTMITGTGSNPYSLTGLTAATTYDWYVQADCGGDQSTWTGPGTFTTTCGTYTPDYLEDFTTFLPNCWDENTGPVTGPTGTSGISAWTSDGFANNGTTGSARINLYSTSHQDWLITPNFDLTGGGFELNFDVAVTTYSGTGSSNMGSDDEVQLLVTTDGGITWSNLMTWNTGNTPSNTGDNTTVDISAYTGNPVQFAFWASDGSVDDTEDYNFYVDNFQVRTPPSCPAPTAQAESNITATSADLDWTNGGSETGWNIEYGPTGFTQGSGTTQAVSSHPYTLTGLTAATTYDWYVQADCGGDQSTWTGPSTFTTACTSVSVSWNEGFEGMPSVGAGIVPNCMAEDGDWATADAPQTYNRDARTGTNYIYTNYSADDWLFSPPIDLTGGTSYDFSFWYVTDGNSGWTTVEAKYGTGQTSGDMTTAIGTPVSGPTNTTYVEYRGSFTPATSGTYLHGNSCSGYLKSLVYYI